jgi:hypothetical protein
MNSAMSFETGTIFLEAGALAPASLVLRCDSLIDEWGVVANSPSRSR